MTKADHRARHVELHKSFDELVADFIIQNPGRLPSNTTCMDLIKWSHRQTLDPTDVKEGEHSIGAKALEPDNPQDRIFELEREMFSLRETIEILTGQLSEATKK